MRLTSLFTRQTDRLRRLPRAVRVVLGLVPIALGAIVLLNPLDSLTLLIALIAICLVIDGVARIAIARRTGIPPLHLAGALLEVAAALAVVAWPAISVITLALVIGVSLIVNGVVDIVQAARRRTQRRIAHLLLGPAFIVFGLLAILWQDIALIVIGVVFAVRMAVFGVGVIVRAVRGDRGARSTGSARSLPRPIRIADVVVSALVLALALTSLGGSLMLHQDVPRPTAFYTPPATVPDRPGQLIRSEPYHQSVPAGARGWLILYTTTDLNGRATVGSGFVMAPDGSSTAPRQVILWDHGTQGADASCAPTLLPPPLPLADPIRAMEDELKAGRVLVGPDYPGMGTAGPQGYLIGQDEGRSALDAVRAAHQLAGLHLSADTVVWGHSQGGHAALWTGILAPSYAPDIHLLGVAAAAPAADTVALVRSLQDGFLSKVLGPFAMRAYAETYPDVHAGDYVDPRLMPLYWAAAARCLPERVTLVSVLTALTIHGPMFSTDPATGALGRRLAQNVPTGHIAAPVLLAQGTADPLILPAVQDAYVTARCAAGQVIDYRLYAGRDHLGVVAGDSPFISDLESWTAARFAGAPAPTACSTTRE